MNTSQQFWSRVDAALDRREDPLADAHVQLLIESDPELLDDYARLRDTLETLRGQTRATLSPIASRAVRHPLADRRFVLLPAALALVLIGLFPRDSKTTDAPAQNVGRVDPHATVHVLEYKVEIITHGSHGSTGSSFHLTDGEWKRSRFAERTQPSPAPSPNTPFLRLAAFSFSETDR